MQGGGGEEEVGGTNVKPNIFKSDLCMCVCYFGKMNDVREVEFH